MTTAAFLGSQTLLKLGDGASPEIFTTIGEVTNIGPLAQKKDLVEVTHMTSTAKEYIGGLTDGQEMSITCNFMFPANTQQTNLINYAGTVSAAKNFRYYLPDGRFSGFSAVVLSSSVGPATPNTATPVTFGLKISGAIGAFA
jgi:hypothetical protein